MRSYILTLPDHVQWKILSFLPYIVLSKLRLSNKQAWTVFNARRRVSQEWNKQVNWMSKLIDIVLPVSDHLFMFTLSDLDYHTQITGHICSYFTVPARTTFELVPLQDLEPSLSFRGFLLKNANCSQIPWNEYKSLCGEDMRRFLANTRRIRGIVRRRMSQGQVSESSPVYAFLERELAHDQHIQMYFDNWREKEDSEEEDGHARLIDEHMYFCDDCEYESSISDYTPSDNDCETNDTDHSEASDTDSDLSISELEGLKDEYRKMVYDHENTRRVKHRQDVEKTMEDSLQKWERGYTSPDDFEYDYRFGSIVCISRGSRSVPPNEGMRKRYCNSFNNSGYCTHGLKCWFRHEKAPVCKYDTDCKGVRCGFYHNPKPDARMAKQLEDMELSISRLKDKNKMKQKTKTINDNGEYEDRMANVDVISTDIDVNINNTDVNSDNADVDSAVDVNSADVSISSTNVDVNITNTDFNSDNVDVDSAVDVNSADVSISSTNVDVMTNTDFNSDYVDINSAVDVNSADVNINYINVDVNSTHIYLNSDDADVNSASYGLNPVDVGLIPADVVFNADIVNSISSNEVNSSSSDVDSVDVDVNSCDEVKYTDDEKLWRDFLKTQAKSSEEFLFLLNKEDDGERWKMKQVYMNNHGPFPIDWRTKIPENNRFPLLFFLSEHPVSMDMVCLRNKQEIENLVVWDVYEMKENNHTTKATTTIFLGLAIVTLNKYHKMPRSKYKASVKYGKYAFGDKTLMAIGMIKKDDVRSFYDQSSSDSRASSPCGDVFWQCFKELSHIPNYCSWADDINNNPMRDDSEIESSGDDDDEY